MEALRKLVGSFQSALPGRFVFDSSFVGSDFRNQDQNSGAGHWMEKAPIGQNPWLHRMERIISSCLMAGIMKEIAPAHFIHCGRLVSIGERNCFPGCR